MKKIVSTSFIILITYFPSFSQLKEDFSDGDFLYNPAWESPSGYFTVKDGMLQLNAPAQSGTGYLSTTSHYIHDATWQFRVRLTFNPSSYNYADIYLYADDKEISDHVLGYLVRIGGQKDAIALIRRNGDSPELTTLVSSPDKITDRDSVDFTVKVTRDREGNWKLFYADFPGTDFRFIGSAQDNRYQNPNYFSIFCHYTATRSNEFFFDDINISGDELKDVSPPVPDTAFAAGKNIVQCVFNEKLDKESALNAGHYLLSGIGNPDSVLYAPVSRSVMLLFSKPLTDRQQYSLQLNGITDLAGNTTDGIQINFTYFNLADAVPGSIIINEFMPDPFPEAGLPGYEFIELFNPTGNFINLSGCTINGAIIPSLFVKPGGYAILCPETATGSFSKYGSPVRGIGKWNTINNSGDEIVLCDPSGIIIDKVVFSNDWISATGKKDGGWSLELINPVYRCWGRKAWGVSLAETGGTPGTENSVYNGKIENAMNGYRDFSTSGKDLSVEFNDPVILTGDSFFSIEGIDIISSRIEYSEPNTVVLNLQDSLVKGRPYTLQIKNVMDCSSTYRCDTSVSVGEGNRPGFLELLITEIMNKPSPSKGLPESEYIELYNPGEKLLSLGGSVLVAGKDTVWLPDKIFLPKEYRILLRKNIASPALGHFILCPELPSLDDHNENLVILNSSGEWVCQVDYKKEWIHGGIPGGISLEMVDTGNPCGMAGNWLLSEAPSGGTPGKINSVTNINPDNFGPVLENVSAIDPDHILMNFSEYISPENMLTANFSINEENVIREFSFLSLNAITGRLQSNLLPGKSYILKARNVTDCTGNIIRNENSESFGLPEEAGIHDIVINELLFNPLPGGVDYIELFNRSGKYIDLEKLYLAAKSDTTASRYPLVITPYIMKPGSYYAFTVNKTRTFNDYPHGELSNIIETDRLPAMNNDRGSVFLFSTNSMLIDRVDYNDNMHFSLLKDTEGVALERIDPEKPADETTNWHSASEGSGFGTPGRKNSESFPDSLYQGHIRIEPEVFVPGKTGSDTQAKIYYSFDKPGMVGSVRIYNVNGMPVRYLADNVGLSTSGYFAWDGCADAAPTWDGTDEKGVLASTGYYIVCFEVFSLDGFRKSYLNKVVLGTQF